MMRNFVLLLLIAFVVYSCNENQPEKDTIKQETSLTLIDKNASSETISLYNRLKDISEKGILYGHQDDLAYGVNWWNEEGRSDVKEVCGSYPAVFGWEIGDLGNERSLDSVKFLNIQNWIVKVNEMGGFNTISWHMINPVTKGNSWDKTKAVYSILPGGKNHDFFKNHLQKFADFNEALIDKNGKAIPIVFRPFHEHNGSWFWWGKEHCSAEEYKELWRFTVNYLCDSLNLHNLIFAYSPDGQFTDYLNRYPDDNYVDIFGFDYYFRGDLDEQTIDRFTQNLIQISELAKTRNKVAILSETGYEAIPNPEWHTKAILKPIKQNKDKIKLAYVLTWRNANKKHHYAPYPGHASIDDFKNFRNDPMVFFLNDIKE